MTPDRARLTPQEALRAATIVPAAFLGKAEEFGASAVGQRAGLLLVEGHPLQDLASLVFSFNPDGPSPHEMLRLLVDHGIVLEARERRAGPLRR
jgi:hypothetical protein